MCYPNTLINGLRRRRLKNNNFPLQISHFNDYIRQSSFCLWLSKYMWKKNGRKPHATCLICVCLCVPLCRSPYWLVASRLSICRHHFVFFLFQGLTGCVGAKFCKWKIFNALVCVWGVGVQLSICVKHLYAFFNFLQHLNFYVTFSGFISIFIFMFLFACRYEACILKFPDAAPNDRNQCECSSAVRGNHLVWNASLLVRPARHCVLQRCLSVCRLRPLLLMLQLCATNF